ncbi:hypothetical protein HDV06_001661 [Boothiomyces sp. JEL0866]|nr:hypothetical protein HDV06_001661 [Boothiomyces sp. JEL0866]
MLYKIQIKCIDTNLTNRINVLQKTDSGTNLIRPLYMPVEPNSAISIRKLYFSKSTPLRRPGIHSDTHLQLVVTVSLVGMDDKVLPLATFTSKSLNVLSITPSQYDAYESSLSTNLKQRRNTICEIPITPFPAHPQQLLYSEFNYNNQLTPVGHGMPMFASGQITPPINYTYSQNLPGNIVPKQSNILQELENINIPSDNSADNPIPCDQHYKFVRRSSVDVFSDPFNLPTPDSIFVDHLVESFFL